MGRCIMVIVLDSGSKVRVEDLVNYQGSLMKCWGGGGENLAMDLHVIPGDGKGVVTLRLHGPLGWSPVFFLLTR